MTKKRWWIVAAILLFLGTGASWAVWFREDPNVARIRELRSLLFSEKREELTDEKRRALFGEMRKASDKLTPEQRGAMMQEDRKKRPDPMADTAAAYCKLPKDQRKAFLDQQIAESEKRRAEWQQQRGSRDRTRGPGRGGNGPGDTAAPGSGDNNRGAPPSVAGNSTAAPPGGSPPASGGRPDGSPAGQPQTRSDWRRMMLDTTTPVERAQRVEYIEAVRARRAELGLPASTGRGPRF